MGKCVRAWFPLQPNHAMQSSCDAGLGDVHLVISSHYLKEMTHPTPQRHLQQITETTTESLVTDPVASSNKNIQQDNQQDTKRSAVKVAHAAAQLAVSRKRDRQRGKGNSSGALREPDTEGATLRRRRRNVQGIPPVSPTPTAATSHIGALRSSSQAATLFEHAYTSRHRVHQSSVPLPAAHMQMMHTQFTSQERLKLRANHSFFGWEALLEGIKGTIHPLLL